jgi:hypothetical protein
VAAVVAVIVAAAVMVVVVTAVAEAIAVADTSVAVISVAVISVAVISGLERIHARRMLTTMSHSPVQIIRQMEDIIMPADPEVGASLRRFGIGIARRRDRLKIKTIPV